MLTGQVSVGGTPLEMAELGVEEAIYKRLSDKLECEGSCFITKAWGKRQIGRLLRFRCSGGPRLSVNYLSIPMISVVKQKIESYALTTARVRTHTDETNPCSNESSEVDKRALGPK